MEGVKFTPSAYTEVEGSAPPKVAVVHKAADNWPAGTAPAAATGLSPVPMLLAITVVAVFVVLAHTAVVRLAKVVFVPSVKVALQQRCPHQQVTIVKLGCTWLEFLALLFFTLWAWLERVFLFGWSRFYL